jgi:hypothetical protein
VLIDPTPARNIAATTFEPAVAVYSMSWRKWAGFAPTWERLHRACPTASYFLSRAWVDCWLHTYGEQLNPELLAFTADGEMVACCLLVTRTQWVKGVPLRRVYLNCAGEDDAECTFIEFNSFVALPEYLDAATGALLNLLRSRRWDELMLQGAIEHPAIETLMRSTPDHYVHEIPARFIDLARLRANQSDFKSALSAQTRYHLRRTEKVYAELGGSCSIRTAETPDEAMEMFHEMAALHQARWTGLGERGAFASQRFKEFHERLIRNSFSDVLLFRLTAGANVIGVIYCVVHRGWVYFYQSGFDYTLDRRRSPGLLTMYYAIVNCLERPDIQGFDLMAGDTRYKKSLTSESDYQNLRWIVVRRHTWATLLFRGLKSVKRTYVELRKSRERNRPEGGTQPSKDIPVQNDSAGELVGPEK